MDTYTYGTGRWCDQEYYRDFVVPRVQVRTEFGVRVDRRGRFMGFGGIGGPERIFGWKRYCHGTPGSDRNQRKVSVTPIVVRFLTSKTGSSRDTRLEVAPEN